MTKSLCFFTLRTLFQNYVEKIALVIDLMFKLRERNTTSIS